MTFENESNPTAITILTAHAYPFPGLDSRLVAVLVTQTDGAMEYEGMHLITTARADVQRWARSVGAAVEFSPGFPE